MIANLLFAVAIAQFPVEPSPSNAGRGKTVLEAVFRDMIRDVPGLSGPYSSPFCLQGPGETDPPAAVMNRIRAFNAQVRPASACRLEKDPNIGQRRWMVERRTGGPAILLRVDSIQCSDNRHCSVSCGYFAASLSASSNIFQVERTGAEWLVTSRRMMLIS